MNEIENKNYIQTVLINPVMSAGKELGKSLQEEIRFTGNNTGNIVFSASMKEQLIYTDEIWINPSSLLHLNKNISLVMPSSNFINIGGDEFINRCIQFLEGTYVPFTMAGLGAQSTKELNTPSKLVDNLSNAKKYFLKLSSERSVSLGVRGDFTAHCLEKLGIHNFHIIGCPSFYKYLDGIFPTLLEPNIQKPLISLNAESEMATKILEFGLRVNAKWIMQMANELPQIFVEEKIEKNEKIQKSYPGLNLSPKEIHSYMVKNAFIFFNFDEWNHYLSKEQFSFAFGSRFHGNMLALRNGIPTLWIVHDSRTSELANTLQLPYIDFNDFKNINHVEEMLEFCDYSSFYSHYIKMCKIYIKYLEENKLNHKFKLKEIST